MSKKTWIIIGVIAVIYLIWGYTLAKANNRICSTPAVGPGMPQAPCPIPVTLGQMVSMPLQVILGFLTPTAVAKPVPMPPVEPVNTGDNGIHLPNSVTTQSAGKKAYSNRDFTTLYDKDYVTTIKNLMKDEYAGIVTAEIPAAEGVDASWEIDSNYIIPKAFVYLT